MKFREMSLVNLNIVVGSMKHIGSHQWPNLFWGMSSDLLVSSVPGDGRTPLATKHNDDQGMFSVSCSE